MAASRKWAPLPLEWGEAVKRYSSWKWVKDIMGGGRYANHEEIRGYVADHPRAFALSTWQQRQQRGTLLNPKKETP